MLHRRQGTYFYQKDLTIAHNDFGYDVLDTKENSKNGTIINKKNKNGATFEHNCTFAFHNPSQNEDTFFFVIKKNTYKRKAAEKGIKE